MTVWFWAFVQMPEGLVGAWLGVGLAEYLIGGLILGLLYTQRGAGGSGAA